MKNIKHGTNSSCFIAFLFTDIETVLKYKFNSCLKNKLVYVLLHLCIYLHLRINVINIKSNKFCTINIPERLSKRTHPKQMAYSFRRSFTITAGCINGRPTSKLQKNIYYIRLYYIRTL